MRMDLPHLSSRLPPAVKWGKQLTGPYGLTQTRHWARTISEAPMIIGNFGEIRMMLMLANS